MPTKEELPLAIKYKELHEAGKDDEIPFEAMELTTVVAEALRMCRLANGPEYFDEELMGVKIGPVSLVGIPGEPFTEIGLMVKSGSPFRMTMVACTTNGSNGYFPVKTAFDEGGYEARTSSYTGAVADDLCNGQLSLLRSLKTSGK
jgi:hypothetical protein